MPNPPPKWSEISALPEYQDMQPRDKINVQERWFQETNAAGKAQFGDKWDEAAAREWHKQNVRDSSGLFMQGLKDDIAYLFQTTPRMLPTDFGAQQKSVPSQQQAPSTGMYDSAMEPYGAASMGSTPQQRAIAAAEAERAIATPGIAGAPARAKLIAQEYIPAWKDFSKQAATSINQVLDVAGGDPWTKLQNSIGAKKELKEKAREQRWKRWSKGEDVKGWDLDDIDLAQRLKLDGFSNLAMNINAVPKESRFVPEEVIIGAKENWGTKLQDRAERIRSNKGEGWSEQRGIIKQDLPPADERTIVGPPATSILDPRSVLSNLENSAPETGMILGTSAAAGPGAGFVLAQELATARESESLMDKLKDSGLTLDQIRTRARISGVAQGAVEMMMNEVMLGQVKNLFKATTGKAMATSIDSAIVNTLNTAGGEGAEELVQEAMSIIAEHPEAKIGDYPKILEKEKDRLRQSFGGGLTTGGVMSGAIQGATVAMNPRAKSNPAPEEPQANTQEPVQPEPPTPRPQAKETPTMDLLARLRAGNAASDIIIKEADMALDKQDPTLLRRMREANAESDKLIGQARAARGLPTDDLLARLREANAESDKLLGNKNEQDVQDRPGAVETQVDETGEPVEPVQLPEVSEGQTAQTPEESAGVAPADEVTQKTEPAPEPYAAPEETKDFTPPEKGKKHLISFPNSDYLIKSKTESGPREEMRSVFSDKDGNQFVKFDGTKWYITSANKMQSGRILSYNVSQEAPTQETTAQQEPAQPEQAQPEQSPVVESPQTLKELKKRAQELQIPNRTTMNAKRLAEAIAERERAAGPQAEPQQPQAKKQKPISKPATVGRDPVRNFVDGFIADGRIAPPPRKSGEYEIWDRLPLNRKGEGKKPGKPATHPQMDEVINALIDAGLAPEGANHDWLRDRLSGADEMIGIEKEVAKEKASKKERDTLYSQPLTRINHTLATLVNHPNPSTPEQLSSNNLMNEMESIRERIEDATFWRDAAEIVNETQPDLKPGTSDYTDAVDRVSVKMAMKEVTRIEEKQARFVQTKKKKGKDDGPDLPGMGKALYGENDLFGQEEEPKGATSASQFKSKDITVEKGDFVPNPEDDANDDIPFMAQKDSVPIGEFKPDPEKHSDEEFKLWERSLAMVKKYGGGKKVIEGRTPRGAMGASYVQSGNIALNALNNISVAVHETTHNIDREGGITGKLTNIHGYDKGKPVYSKNSEDLRRDLVDVYQKYYGKPSDTAPMQKKLVEGFATFVEQYIQDPTGMRSLYPTLYRDIILKGGRISHKKIRGLVKEALRIVNDYSKLDYISRMNARTVEERKRRGKPWLNWKDRQEAQMLDRVWPVEKFAQEAGVRLSDKDPSVAVRQYERIAMIFANNVGTSLRKETYMALRKGEFKKLFDFNWRTLERTLRKDGMTKSFNGYLIGRESHYRYEELDDLKEQYDSLKKMYDESMAGKYKARDKLTDADRQAIEDMERKLKSQEEKIAEREGVLKRDKITREEATGSYEQGKRDMPNLKKYEDMFDKLVRADLDSLHEVGKITDDTYETLKSRKGYVTKQRALFDDLADPEFGESDPSGKIKSGTLASLKRRRGGEQTIVDPIYASISNHYDVLGTTMRQHVWNMVGALADKTPGLLLKEELKTLVDKETGQISYPQEKDPKVIMTRPGGKRVPYEVNTELKKYLDAVLTPEAVNNAERILAASNRLFTKGTTSWYPSFMIMNFIVDQITATAQTRTGYKPVISQLSLIANSLRNENSEEAEYFREYMAMAGASQTFSGWNELTPRQARNAIAKEREGLTKILDYWESAEKFVSTPSQMSEIASRVTEYINARKSGDGQFLALEKAGRVTAPFHHRGAWGGLGTTRAIVRGLPYFNSGLQASKEYGKAWFDERRGKVALVTALMIGAKMAELIPMMMMASDDQKEKYKDLDPNELGRYLWLPSRNGIDLLHYRVPEQMTSLAVGINMALQEHLKFNNYSFEEYKGGMTAWIPDQFDVTEPTRLLVSWIPQLVRPTAEVVFNVKTWPRIRPLESQSQEGLPAKFRAYRTTSELAKAISSLIGEKTGLSPIKVDHLIEGYLGRTVRFITKFKREAAKLMNPFLRESYFDAGRRVQNFYEREKEITEILNAIKSEKIKVSEKVEKTLKRQKEIANDVNRGLKEYRALPDEDIVGAKVLRSKIIDSIDAIETDEFFKSNFPRKSDSSSGSRGRSSRRSR